MSTAPYQSANGHQPAVTVMGRPRRFTAWLGPDDGTEPAHAKPPLDRAGKWLRTAMVALGALALAAAAVSYQAQYAMVLAYKGSRIIAAVQAGIPDAGALVFASLGIALALQGARAIRPRVLNLVCVGISIAMNALAATAGWTATAVWVFAPILYALASDTLVAVIRAWSIARQRELDGDLADDDGSPLGILGGIALWLLRLALAPRSTLGGFRAWVLEEVRVAPGRVVPQAASQGAAEGTLQVTSQGAPQIGSQGGVRSLPQGEARSRTDAELKPEARRAARSFRKSHPDSDRGIVTHVADKLGIGRDRARKLLGDLGEPVR